MTYDCDLLPPLPVPTTLELLSDLHGGGPTPQNDPSTSATVPSELFLHLHGGEGGAASEGPSPTRFSAESSYGLMRHATAGTTPRGRSSLASPFHPSWSSVDHYTPTPPRAPGGAVDHYTPGRPYVPVFFPSASTQQDGVQDLYDHFYHDFQHRPPPSSGAPARLPSHAVAPADRWWAPAVDRWWEHQRSAWHGSEGRSWTMPDERGPWITRTPTAGLVDSWSPRSCGSSSAWGGEAGGTPSSSKKPMTEGRTRRAKERKKRQRERHRFGGGTTDRFLGGDRSFEGADRFFQGAADYASTTRASSMEQTTSSLRWGGSTLYCAPWSNSTTHDGAQYRGVQDHQWAVSDRWVGEEGGASQDAFVLAEREGRKDRFSLGTTESAPPPPPEEEAPPPPPLGDEVAEDQGPFFVGPLSEVVGGGRGGQEEEEEDPGPPPMLDDPMLSFRGNGGSSLDPPLPRNDEEPEHQDPPPLGTLEDWISAEGRSAKRWARRQLQRARQQVGEDYQAAYRAGRATLAESIQSRVNWLWKRKRLEHQLSSPGRKVVETLVETQESAPRANRLVLLRSSEGEQHDPQEGMTSSRSHPSRYVHYDADKYERDKMELRENPGVLEAQPGKMPPAPDHIRKVLYWCIFKILMWGQMMIQ